MSSTMTTLPRRMILLKKPAELDDLDLDDDIDQSDNKSDHGFEPLTATSTSAQASTSSLVLSATLPRVKRLESTDDSTWLTEFPSSAPGASAGSRDPLSDLEDEIIYAENPAAQDVSAEPPASCTVDGPIQQLPNELLTLIFEQGSFLTHPKSRDITSRYMTLLPDNSRPFMSTVAKVSQRWRHVAINNPALWSFIHISGGPHIDELHRQTDWVPTHLQRSQSLPIDIVLCTAQLSAMYIVRQLERFSDRIRSLNIIVPNIFALPPIIAAFEKVSAPNLETLEISSEKFHDGAASETLRNMGHFLSSSPKLAHVRLIRVYTLWRSAPLRGLTSLELIFITWPDYTEFGDMLAESPALETLIMHVDSSSRRLERQNRPPISLPNLRKLEIRAWYSTLHDNFSSLFQLFAAPALQCVTLKGITASEWCRLLVYFRTQRNNYPLLRSLDLANIKGLIFVDSSAVRAFPHLEHLSLTGIYSNAFCQLLLDEKTDDGYRVPVWPHLKTLSIASDADSNPALLQGAIAARLSIGRPIARLILDRPFFENASMVNVVTWLREFTTLENGQ
ncbi:hypothetical protein C8J56DRAFT_859690 [Mycena floridula]|nr:hypothetical protein C8J56DRAFT_859690 [Mycena floridula]